MSDSLKEAGDWMARQFFSSEDLQTSPEEYAARHAHEWGSFSLHLHRYEDPELGAWVRRLGEILFSREEVERCRQRFLNAAEQAEIKSQEAEGF